ncbi:cytochrome P450 [Dentipellis sp. KUC8613]|nr:cytochrome P450 [Dentipellis sp. KUC8613]
MPTLIAPALPSPSTVILIICAALFVYLLSPLFALLIHDHKSALRLLPGPPSTSFVTGNLAQVADQENNDIISTWTANYGTTLVYRGFVGGRRLLTTDPVALSWILGRAYDFPKPEFVRESLASMAAGHEGLVVVEGETHRRQNQAFTTPHIKSLLPIFLEKACQLRDIFVHIASSASAPSSPSIPHGPIPQQDSFAFLRSLDPPRPASENVPAAHDLRRRCRLLRTDPDEERGKTEVGGDKRDHEGHPTVDVLSWLGRATLDVIGEAGFGYHFNSLRSARRALDRSSTVNGDPFGKSSAGGAEKEDENELATAFGVIFSTARKFRVFTIFQVWFPVLRRFRPNNKTMSEARATMRRIGLQLIAERRAEALADTTTTSTSTTSTSHTPDSEKAASAPGRDILSVLVRSSLASSPAQGLSESEVLSQIATFIAAGHETSASALTWTLYALARREDSGRAVQARLRAELRRIGAEAGGDDAALLGAIERCALLDRVVREALRLHAPVGSTMRVYRGAEEEVVVPVLRGVRVRRSRTLGDVWRWVRGAVCGSAGGRDKVGEWTVERGFRLRRGDIITIPIQAVNRCKEIWGEDAKEFRPDRWLNPPEAAQAIQGLYSNTLTFLNGAPTGGNGHRGCIGYKFALYEIKIFLYVLLRDIEFSLDEDVVIEKRVNVVTRPFVKSAPGSGNQMPLRIRVVPADEDEDAPELEVH